MSKPKPKLTYFQLHLPLPTKLRKKVLTLTEEKKLYELLKEIGRVIKEKNDDICLKDFQLADLRKKLEQAENKIKELCEVKNDE